MSPWAPRKPCPFARDGCWHTVTASEPCPVHGKKRRWEDGRPSASARGYGESWRRLRAQVLAEEPVCRHCPAPSTQVDHVVPKSKGGTDARNNLAGVCRDCHNSKTGLEGQAARKL